MRRFLSSLAARALVVAQIVVLAAAPALAALPSGTLAAVWSAKSDESRLPACCRRGGLHHCAMGIAAEGAPERETFVSANERCPLCPRALASTAPQTAALAQSASKSVEFPILGAFPGATDTVAPTSGRRGWPKRGPPSLLAL